ncbi:polysaccharide deacetylase family protein [Saccharibacillus alkalitolerans]|uniref:Polysaccharide deacetylase family protein n=1 Tax=Saccharibacillus alkalitolerans TaxID=2705290 RepID=A0ABX0EZP5_9BACL|nr:polysaccharide deacetylase family protein [Saccharibacillus alkalitolerans]NGZ74226.1 polysaccharide deacetylase family protein [Saccharibacillus alkalitolerans]
MWKKTALFWLAAGLVLGACGNAADEPKTADSKQTTAETQPADAGQASGSEQDGAAAEDTKPAGTDEAATDEAAAQDATDAAAAEGTEASGTPATGDETAKADAGDAKTDAAAEVPIEYHMNGNYDIVPNEGSKAPKKVVLLTFDDGPKEAEMINGLFDTLDKHNAKAIFFVNGYRVKEHPELLKLIQERGGIIGNHSYDHIYLNQQTNDEIKKQIEDVQTIVKETIGETPMFFRPPNAAGNDYAHQVAKENGLLYMTWSVGSLDWVNKDDPKAVVDNVFDQLHSGSNILMHELPWTVEALDDLLTKLEAKGYGFVDPRSIDTTKQP